MKYERKSLGGLELKADEPGSIVARFSTFGVIDHDGDIVERSAFTDGAKVAIGPWNHGRENPPIGGGTVMLDDAAARIDGRLFLESSLGRDHYVALKELTELGAPPEWSYIFQPTRVRFEEREGKEIRIIEALDLWRVDPVDRGAGIDTTTESVKSAGAGERYADQAARVLTDVAALIDRSEEIAELRSKDGRPTKLTERTIEALTGLRIDLAKADDRLAALLVVEPSSTNEYESIRSYALKASAARRRMRELSEVS